MELKDLVKTFKKNLAFIAFFVLLGAILAYLISFKMPTGQKATQVLYVQVIYSEVPVGESGYYKQERARNFTDTAIVLIQEDNLGIALNPGQSYNSKKLATQVIRVEAYAKTKEDAQIVLQNVLTQAEQKISTLTSGEIKLTSATDAKISGFGPSHKIYVLAGAMIGLAFASFVVILKDYFNT